MSLRTWGGVGAGVRLRGGVGEEEPAGPGSRPEGFLEGEGGQGAEFGLFTEASGLQGSSRCWSWVLRSGFRPGGGLPEGPLCPFFQLILMP